jgi:hypothetical protein
MPSCEANWSAVAAKNLPCDPTRSVAGPTNGSWIFKCGPYYGVGWFNVDVGSECLYDASTGAFVAGMEAGMFSCTQPGWPSSCPNAGCPGDVADGASDQ